MSRSNRATHRRRMAKPLFSKSASTIVRNSETQSFLSPLCMECSKTFIVFVFGVSYSTSEGSEWPYDCHEYKADL